MRPLYELEPSAPLARLADRLRLMQAATKRRETDFTEFERHETLAPDASDSEAPAAAAAEPRTVA